MSIHSPIRVLVVDDEPIALAAHADYVRRLDGFEVVAEAHGMQAALAALNDPAIPAVQLILLDMNLTDGHGLDLLRRIHGLGLVPDVVAITAVRDVHVVRSAIALGITAYLIKPFTFAEWLNSGHRINDTVDASVRRYPQSRPWNNSCGSTTGFYDSSDPQVAPDLQNADGPNGIYYRTFTARQGLSLSLNTATMATAAQLDICNIQKMMTATGIHMGSDVTKPYNVSSISALLGSGEVAPLTMANAFATFASGGKRCDPIALVSITNAKGDKFPVPGANCQQTVKPEVAAGVNMVLQQVLQPGGSGYAIPLQYPAGAKTGTTNTSEQTWTVGYTKGLATASWVGNPEEKGQSTNDKLIAGQRIPYVDGSTYAGKAWQGYMNQVAGNFDVSGFDLPPASMISPPVVVQPKPAETKSAESDKKAEPESKPADPKPDNGNGNSDKKD